MKKIDSVLQSMPLFKHIQPDKYTNVLSCLNGRIQDYAKGEIIYSLQDPLKSAGIVLSGRVNMSMVSVTGTEHYVQQFDPGDIFGEALACRADPMDNGVLQITAVQKSSILFVCLSHLFMEKALTCPYASQVALNLLKEVVDNNIFLSRKVEILSQKKIRDRIFIYLQSVGRSGNTVNIPFNRQELANFLGVDRSALSRELCLMRDEGMIDFYKNEIILLRNDLIS